MQVVYGIMYFASVLIWIDVVIIFVAARDHLTFGLRQFFKIAFSHGLKPSKTKSILLCREDYWCGKVLGAPGFGTTQLALHIAATSSKRG